MKLLKQLCQLQATAGNESSVKDFIINYVRSNQKNWRNSPKIHQGRHLQENLILEFGNPRTAAFAHMDSVGFTVGYFDQLIPIGSPQAQQGDILIGHDRHGPIECTISVQDEGPMSYQFARGIERGTDLVYKCRFHENEDYIESCSLDNRLGVYNLLKLAESLDHGLLVFSSREEHHGGSIPVLARYIHENFELTQTLISDITWVTEGVSHGQGVAISLRDRGIPRKAYVDRILDLAHQSKIPYQLEVESSGSSDAGELQASPYPFDWCFIGAAESQVHSACEKVHKADIESMLALYRYLMLHL